MSAFEFYKLLRRKDERTLLNIGRIDDHAEHRSGAHVFLDTAARLRDKDNREVSCPGPFAWCFFIQPAAKALLRHLRRRAT